MICRQKDLGGSACNGQCEVCSDLEQSLKIKAWNCKDCQERRKREEEVTTEYDRLKKQREDIEKREKEKYAIAENCELRKTILQLETDLEYWKMRAAIAEKRAGIFIDVRV